MQIEIHGSHGILTVDADTGAILSKTICEGCDPADKCPGYDEILKIDIDQLRVDNNCKLDQSFDILEVGYWYLKDGTEKYEPVDRTFIEVRREWQGKRNPPAEGEANVVKIIAGKGVKDENEATTILAQHLIEEPSKLKELKRNEPVYHVLHVKAMGKTVDKQPEHFGKDVIQGWGGSVEVSREEQETFLHFTHPVARGDHLYKLLK